MKKPLNWVPLWIDPWLFGSTRIELTLEQRAIWIDLLALAGKDQGFIRANENMPYPIEQLSGLLRIPVDLLEQTINKCLETGKLTKTQSETLYVTNWELYKLTPQYRRKLIPGEENKREENKGEESKRKGNTVSQKGNNRILPPIPKGISFSMVEKLEKILESIRYKKKLLKDEKKMQNYGYTKEKLEETIEEHSKQYLDLVGQYER
jgi:hypothetical protein